MNLRSPKVLTAIGVVATLLLALIVVIALLRTGGAQALSDNAALIGALVALGGVFTTQMVSSALEDRRTQEARNTEEQRTQAAALTQYFEQMAELVEKGLRDSSEDDEKRVLARTQTLLVLRGLDPRRKWLLLDFLYESKLLNRAGPIVNLESADLRDGVFSEYVTLRTAENSDTRKYLGDPDPKKYLSKGDFSSILSIAGGIPQPLLEILLGGQIFVIELDDTDLHGTIFVGAFLRQASLSNTDLEGAILIEADLIGAELPNACLRTADLASAVLISADLRKAELTQAILLGSVLIKADLREADLRGADLREADLREADLSEADLRGVTGITNEELEHKAASLQGAIMPDGSKHP